MKITQTRRYDSFISDINNRPITDKDATKLKKLKGSMLKYGFLPFPILVRRVGEKLRIIDGQHRARIAEELALPIYYVETDRDDIVIAECAAAQSSWKLFDYISTYSAQGNEHYEKLIAFAKETELPVASAACLLAGESGGSNNTHKRITAGEFRVRDLCFARRVAALVNSVRVHVLWALNRNNVGAISRLARVSEFDDEQFIAKVNAHPHLLRHCATMDAFSDMYDALYNHCAHAGKRIPLAFLAKEGAAKRSMSKKAA